MFDRFAMLVIFVMFAMTTFAHACHASGQCFDSLPHIHVNPRRMPETEKRKKDKKDKDKKSKKSKKSKKDDGGERGFSETSQESGQKTA